MAKEFFTVNEAVTWLSKHGGDEFSREDLLRANEKGHISIYFDHTGNIGVFPDDSGPNSSLIPKSARLIYFVGVLKSLSGCKRGVKTYPMRGPETTSDILRPRKVEVMQSEILHSHPDIRTLNAFGTFFGRVGGPDNYLDHITEIPESAWRFHIDDLCNLTGSKQETAPKTNANTNTLLTSQSGDDWTAQARKIADELYDRDTTSGCRDSLKNYSKRVMAAMQERKINGARGTIDNANTVMRDALQGGKWWKNKSK